VPGWHIVIPEAMGVVFLIVFTFGDPQVAFRRFMQDELVQDRLRIGFGKDAAYNRFMGDITDEFEAQLSRNRILTGSRTTPLAEDIAAVNDAAGGGNVIDHALRIASDSRSIWRQSLEGSLNLVRRARQAGTGLNNPEVSRLLGEALFESGDPERLLQAMIQQRVISPDEVKFITPYIAAGAGQATAGSFQ
jgi:hypothetical protein